MGKLVVPMDFLALEETPYDILIGLPTMIQLWARPDYCRLVLKIHYGRDSEILNYEYERDSANTSEDDFTPKRTEEDEQAIEDSIEELVMMLNEPEKRTKSSDEDQLVDEKLSHLNTKYAEPDVIANSFEDVGPSTVSVLYHFELTSENPINQKARRMSPSHNDFLRKELERMLTAGIITPVQSSRTPPVVITTKKDGSARFCVEYRNLNSALHADRCPLPRADEIQDDMRGSLVFTTIDLSHGYWQIEMDETYK